MKESILIVGDCHGDTSHLLHSCVAAQGAGVTKLMFVGDFGAWEHMADGRKFFDNAEKFAKRFGVVIYWLDGNHDKTSLVVEMYGDNRDEEGFLICRENVRYAPRGHRWTWGESRCIALGGAYSVDKGWRVDEERNNTLKSERSAAKYGATPRDFSGTLWFPEEEMTDEQFEAILAENGSPVDVIFCHDKPRASNPGWNRKDFLECLPNQDRIQQAIRMLRPAWVYHGHLHFPYESGIYNGEGTNAWVTVRGLDCGQPGYHPNWSVEDSWCTAEL